MAIFSMYLSVVLGVGSLAWAYQFSEYQFVTWILTGFGVIWWLTLLRRQVWVSSAGLLLLVAAAMHSLWIGLPFGWALTGTVGGLLAYDLTDFNRRLRLLSREQDTRPMQITHLTRLGVLILITMGLGSFAMWWKLQFTFEWAVVLVLASIWGLSMMVHWLRRNSS